MLKKMFFVTFLALGLNGVMNAQVINFEDLSLPTDSFWNGSDLSNGFSSATYAQFPNTFVDYGGGYIYWDGFGYSNRINDSLQDFSNQYSSFAGEQIMTSSVFGISYNPMDYLTYETLPTTIHFSVLTEPLLFSVSNSAYTALTIKNGDMFCKKFGGVTENDPDWFRLDIIGLNNSVVTDTIHFYLADYRFVDNMQDYIIKNWTDVDLTSLGQVTDIQFLLSSTDTGAYGMNTPAYFCFDNLYCNFLTQISQNELTEQFLYPNPTTGIVNATKKINKISIFSVDGKEVYKKTGLSESFDISDISKGVYIVKARSGDAEVFQKIVKK